MQWEPEAETIIDAIALPPMMAELARLDARRRALRSGSPVVTARIARQTQAGYEKLLGSEAIALIAALGRGEDPGLPEEFFETDDQQLLRISLCPAQYGACTAAKREMMRRPIRPIKQLFIRHDMTGAIMEKTRVPLLTHHLFSVAISGCPNGCLSPYAADLGIICLYWPHILPQGCTGCGACARACRDRAITLDDHGPRIDPQRCLLCGEGIPPCPAGGIQPAGTGYKVVAGGSGGRHPVIGRTVSACTDLPGVLQIADNLFQLYRRTPPTGDELSVHDLITRQGVAQLQPDN